MSAPTKRTLAHTTTMTSREFNQHTGRAKAAADHGPVVITDRGKPAYVLLSSEEFERIAGKKRFVSVAESIADTRPEADFPFEFERVRGQARDVDFGFDD